MYRRNIETQLIEAAQDTPVLVINGSRQVGKSTLAESIFKETHEYFTLDDLSTRIAISRDPLLFLENLKKPIILDEVQRLPEIFLPIKKIVDEKRRPGFFVLTGSSNILTLPRIADSLAGRIEIHTLWPFSQGELLGHKDNFVDALFNNTLDDARESISDEDLTNRIITGGYPSVIERKNEERRRAWFRNYITSIVERDILEHAKIDRLGDVSNLIHIFASRVGTLFNASEISRVLSIPNTTLNRYIGLLKQIFLLILIPPYFKSLTKRLVKTPKVYLNDTGIVNYLNNADSQKLSQDSVYMGHVLENFVVMELLKQQTWCKTPFNIYHYRSHSGMEVDFVLENFNGKCIAIEIKKSKHVTLGDFKGIDAFEKDIEKNFQCGIILYQGNDILPFKNNWFAIPIAKLWKNYPGA